MAESLRSRGLDVLRRIGARPRILPLTALLLRAWTVRPALAFVAREALRREGVFVYRLREQGMSVAIRHRSGDVVTLGEVFHDHQYRPLPEVEPALASVGSVLDLGANIGLFGAFAAERWPQAEIVAFEPDPANASLHERTIEMNGLRERWRLVHAAAGAGEGRAEFVTGGVALSHLAGALEDADEEDEWEGGRVVVPVRDVLGHVAGADLVKMDVEGGEWAIIGDPRFSAAPPRVLVLEYHPRFCPAADPRAEVERVLAGAGMRTAPLWHRADGHGMLWAWRR